VDKAYYTEDFFKTKPKLLLSNISTCVWGRSTDQLTSVPNQSVFCIWGGDTKNKDAASIIKDSKLVHSENFFQNDKTLIDFDFDGVPDGGVIGVTISEKFIIAAVKRDVSSEELTLFVSQEGKVWAEAHIPDHKSLKHNAFTVLESTPSSLALDVVFNSSDKFGTLYLSNSNGTYFTTSLSHTNRDSSGIVDAERIPGTLGTTVANIVSNWEEIQRTNPNLDKKLHTQITYNNGAKWNYLPSPEKDCNGKSYSCKSNKNKEEECSLHLHSITVPHNLGRMFSASSTPGILIGVGSVGSHLEPYDEGDTFISRDNGRTWTCAREGPHKYALLDMGNNIALVKDTKKTNTLVYSSDLGNSWKEKDLGVNIRPLFLTTQSDSTSQVALLLGQKDDKKHVLIQLDFSKLFDRKCDINKDKPQDSKDLELWKPKYSSSDSKSCVMGSETEYYRRKKDADCYIGDKFGTPITKSTECPCTEEDYECDYEFIEDKDGKCVLKGKELIPKGSCLNGEKKYFGSSGYRLIPGNTCNMDSKESKIMDESIEKDCSEGIQQGNGTTHQIYNVRTQMQYNILSHFYFNSSEALLILTHKGEVFSSLDGGLSWDIKFTKDVLSIHGHPYAKDRAYVLLKGTGMMVTNNRGSTFEEVKLPELPNNLKLSQLEFNSVYKDHIIFIGSNACPNCVAKAYLSTDNGKSWKQMIDYAHQCAFGKESFSGKSETIFCSRFIPKDSKADQSALENNRQNPDVKLELVTIKDGRTNKILDNIGDFNIVSDYLLVYQKSDQANLLVSKDGVEFTKTVFPPDLVLNHDSFTILDSYIGGDRIPLTLLKVPVIGQDRPTFGDSSYPIGSLFVSNFNATSYSLSLPNIRSNSKGLVDAESVYGLAGALIANQMIAITADGEAKSKSSISFDNGGSWYPIAPPKKDINGKEYECLKDKCSLHLHTFFDKKQTMGSFGTPNSQGYVIGVGNVGQHLLSYEDSSTFFSKDGGVSWKEIRSAESLYAIGDSGSILVLVDDEGPTKDIVYSIDGGSTWNTHNFIRDPVRVASLITAPTGQSLKFTIIGFGVQGKNPKNAGSFKNELVTIDFSKVLNSECKMDSSSSKSDFEEWIPSRPTLKYEKDGNPTLSETTCLLGQESIYHRKKPDRLCYLGNSTNLLHKESKTCECTELDYECDVGYWRTDMNHGDCVLFGKDPLRPADCKIGDKYKSNSGYRKISSSTCKGGLDLTKSVERECTQINGVNSKIKKFDSSLSEYFYFRESQTLVAHLENGKVFMSQNEGLTWSNPFEGKIDKVAAVFHHSFIDDSAYFLTTSKTHYFTHDELRTSTPMNTPTEPNTMDIPAFAFHPEESSWLIFHGMQDCESKSSGNCHVEAYASQNNGETWKSIGKYVRNCQWARTKKFNHPSKQAIYCEKYKQQSGNQRNFAGVNLNLLESDSLFDSNSLLFDNISGLSIFHEYLVVATPGEKYGTIELQTSTDGKNFIPAKYPPNVGIAHQGFTVLESNTHSLFLHITTNANIKEESGIILTSNSNGTHFTTSLDNVNRDSQGLVDFEKMAGIEGIAIANQISNPKELKITKKKEIVSKITFNNGANWRLLSIPSRDIDGNYYSCKGDNCGLHLHSFTRLSDPENIFSSSSSVGIMIGIGNVGEKLLDYNSADTFLTRDAGLTWSQIRKGPHRFEFGDQGAVMLLVDDTKAVDSIMYTFDQGLTFQSIKLDPESKTKYKITEVTTEPQSTSQKFVLFGYSESNSRELVAFHFDFSGLHDRQCISDINFSNTDFEKWTPSSKTGNNCLFGKQVI
jgi:hypothetical protein